MPEYNRQPYEPYGSVNELPIRTINHFLSLPRQESSVERCVFVPMPSRYSFHVNFIVVSSGKSNSIFTFSRSRQGQFMMSAKSLKGRG
jgi:hypothetical protein